MSDSKGIDLKLVYSVSTTRLAIKLALIEGTGDNSPRGCIMGVSRIYQKNLPTSVKKKKPSQLVCTKGTGQFVVGDEKTTVTMV